MIFEDIICVIEERGKKYFSNVKMEAWHKVALGIFINYYLYCQYCLLYYNWAYNYLGQFI